MLYRYAFDDFKLWIESEDPRCLVLIGARQVGKTTVRKLYVEFQVRGGIDPDDLSEWSNSITSPQTSLIAGRKFNHPTASLTLSTLLL